MGQLRSYQSGRTLAQIALIAVIALVPLAAAQAYVGPGAGLSLLGALWGVLAAIGGALAFVIMWPIRRMRRRKREAARAAENPSADTQSTASDEASRKHTSNT